MLPQAQSNSKKQQKRERKREQKKSINNLQQCQSANSNGLEGPLFQKRPAGWGRKQRQAPFPFLDFSSASNCH
jgi:hypothetical protein